MPISIYANTHANSSTSNRYNCYLFHRILILTVTY